MNTLLSEIQAYVRGFNFSDISEERKKVLDKLSDHIRDKREGSEINLNFICTHNSRRSQLCQVWAHTAAFYFGINNVRAFSGGTEATAFHPNAIRALKQAGFHTTNNEKQDNPVYFILCSQEADPLPCFSKLYNDPLNSTAPFIAVMTCSDAETNCPFIPDAETRISVKYEDPKKADGTPQEVETYAERNRQIAIEMFYVFSKIEN